MKRKYLFFLFFLASCSASKISKWNEELKNTDKNFSSLSEEKGMKLAFLSYIDSSGVMMRANGYPLVGNNAIKSLQSINDSSFQLKWSPLFASSSRNGDLGYTYGIYSRKTKVGIEEGTYVTIWKRQKDGSWKFVLDSGNEGLGKPSH